MLDHISFAVEDLEKSLHFYDETLKILSVERITTFDTPDSKVAGYGIDGKTYLWIGKEFSPNTKEDVGKARGFHLAFKASSVQEVNDWYNLCLKLGGIDNGKPGPRAHYHPGYYGAFIIDPNGWRIEAAFHEYVGK